MFPKKMRLKKKTLIFGNVHLLFVLHKIEIFFYAYQMKYTNEESILICLQNIFLQLNVFTTFTTQIKLSPERVEFM